MWPIAVLPITLLGTYALFYFHNNFLNPRLLLEAFVPLVVLITATACSLRWVGVALMLNKLLDKHKLLAIEQDNAHWLPVDTVAEKMATAPSNRKLIFVSTKKLQPQARWTHYSLNMILKNAPTHNAPVVFAHDLEDSANQALLNSVENRQAYQLKLAIDPSTVQSYHARLVPTLVPYSPAPDPIHTISLLTHYPLTPRPACGFAEPATATSGEPVLQLTTTGTKPCAFELKRIHMPTKEWTVALDTYSQSDKKSWSLETQNNTIIGTASLAGDGTSRTVELKIIATKSPQSVHLIKQNIADLRALRFLPRKPPAPNTE